MRKRGARSPALASSIAVYLLDEGADATEGHTAVHLLGGAAEAVTVSLGVTRRAAPLSTSLTGRLTQREVRPWQRERHAAVHLPNGAAEATEGHTAVHLLDGAADAAAVPLKAARCAQSRIGAKSR